MIQEFFAGKEVFVTGGSGVVGTALIEKLLRSCNVKKIYILLRAKKNFDIEKRFQQLKNEMIFRRLRQEKPHELDKKLVCIPGDALLPLLGITKQFQNILSDVSIIIHSAATVRFNEPLTESLRLNVGGTLELIKFAQTLKHLEVFMHVSTYFSNPYLKRIEEKVYKSPLNWKTCLDLLNRNDITEEQLDIITRKLIIGFPNTYCFTKNLAESLVNDYRDKLPVAIFRPSVVLFAIEEPEPGFSGTLMGVMGLISVSGAGVLKTFYISKDVKLDITPLDVAIKTLCYYTLKTADLYKKPQKPKTIPVFIASSCTHTDITFVQYVTILQDHDLWLEAAFEKNFLIPGIYCTDKRFVFLLLNMLKHILPSILADIAFVLSGRKPVLMRLHRKIFNTAEIMKPFCFNNYESAGITDIEEILDKLKGTDFNLDLVLSGNDYFKTVAMCQTMAYSARANLLKENPQTIPKSRKILQLKMFLYKTFKWWTAFKLFEYFLYYVQHFYSVELNSTFFVDDCV